MRLRAKPERDDDGLSKDMRIRAREGEAEFVMWGLRKMNTFVMH